MVPCSTLGRYNSGPIVDGEVNAGAECGAWRLNAKSLCKVTLNVEGTGVHLKGTGGMEWSLEIDKRDPPGIFTPATPLY